MSKYYAEQICKSCGNTYRKKEVNEAEFEEELDAGGSLGVVDDIRTVRHYGCCQECFEDYQNYLDVEE